EGEGTPRSSQPGTEARSRSCKPQPAVTEAGAMGGLVKECQPVPPHWYDWPQMKTLLTLSLSLLPLFAGQSPDAPPGKPLRLAIAGLVHGHVDGFLRAVHNRTDVQIVGVFEPDKALQHKYAQKYGLAEALFFTDLASMLDRAKPEAVATFTSTYDHSMVVEACASRHVHVMMEKPLAVGMEHARAIQRA